MDGQLLKLRALETNIICEPLFRPKIPFETVASFNSIQLADDYFKDRTLKIDILIGVDRYWDFIRPHMSLSQGRVVALNSPFSWVLSGNISGPDNMSSKSVVQYVHATQLLVNSLSDDDLKRFWDLESVGIKEDETRDVTNSRV